MGAKVTSPDGIDKIMASPPQLGASIAVFRDASCREVLLVLRGKPPLANLWSFPGGRIEPGETAAAAALRELSEETGTTAHAVRQVDVCEVIRHAPDGHAAVHFVLTVFAGLFVAGTPVAGDDARDVRWVMAEDISSLQTTEGLPGFVHSAAAMVRGDALLP